MRVHIVRRGGLQFVQIPAELAFDGAVITVEVERRGDDLVLRPIERKLGDLMDVFASFTPDFMASGRESKMQVDRNPLNDK